jgi:ATP-dependent Lhr-like helicase
VSPAAAKRRKTKAPLSRAGKSAPDALSLFHPLVAEWFGEVFDAPTTPQQLGWPAIARGESTLILAPTGTGKTLTAFLWCLNRLMFEPKPPQPAAAGKKVRKKMKPAGGCRVIYISPLKALAVDVERNLQSPLVGIANLAARKGVAVHIPEIALRTGDTSSKDRSRFRRAPAEILITTPESLYLLLTSQSAEGLKSVDTVIIDEIHALVPTKRGAHLALTLERLEALTGRRLQRIGLSATQRPLEEVARFLGGADAKEAKRRQAEDAPLLEGDAASEIAGELSAEGNSLTGQASEQDLQRAAPFRPVTIVNASARKQLALRIEVPVEDMARLGEPEELPSGPASQGPKRTSIWTAIYPRLLELIRARTSTLLFVNSRRIAERLAGALNELAEEPLARAHHGSLAAAQRAEIEELLKAGRIKALVATSSLELGIDMGAIDLVIQIEAPPSVASGMQRIGRAGHQVGAVSEGVLFPKYRADLVACAAVTRAMHEGLVESTRYLRNPLDVLAQQIVAIVASPPAITSDDNAGISFEALYALVRRSAPFAELTRNSFSGVLDMLAGRYPSDEFAELRPRLTWDRIHDVITPREGAKSLAILNGGTIPDRGTYGVFLSGTGATSARVGELDEEMVFESRQGDTFVLGATTWRIQEITRDRVEVVPAPGEPGKMPFWHGDRAGRPLEFGQRIGALVRELRAMPRNAAISRLVREHDLAPLAAENLLRFLADQEIATEAVPDDRTILVEKCRDELGDWRVCVLTPFGSRIHAPWAMAVSARLRASGGAEVETMWGDDGFVLRFPDTDVPPDLDFLLLDPAEASDLVLRQLGSTAMFAAKFRESAARALLLPRRRAQGRAPLWAQRKRAYDLLTVASRYPAFPILLEAYRECLRDVFDMPAFVQILRDVEQRRIRVHSVETRTPSPFASSLLFSYVANYIYDGDAPLAERRAQALTLDQDQLRELLGEADLRELLDADAIQQVEEQLQSLADTWRARTMDGVHDLLLRIGDLSQGELRVRSINSEVAETASRLVRARRALELKIAGTRRYIAMEDAGKYRDALGVALPPGIPTAFLAKTAAPALELVKRFARTHGPFTAQDVSARLGLPAPQVEAILKLLAEEGRVMEGGFRPGGVHREWCDAEVLRLIRRKSLARLRKQIEAVPQATLARLNTHWQGLASPRRGMDALLDTIELLQGVPLPASLLEGDILSGRVTNYSANDLDTLFAAGELVWVGVDPIGEHDGRVALYLTDRFADLWPPQALRNTGEPSEPEQKILDALANGGAQFFAALHDAAGGGYPGETLDALWSLVWQGRVTNDSLHALRAYLARPSASRAAKRTHNQQAFRSRRATPPSAQGRWTLLQRQTEEPSATEWLHKMAHQMLQRYGVLVREAAAAENMPGGFSAMYGVLKALEESGRIRRGYFVEGLGATQFALPAAVDLLRSLRNAAETNRQEIVLMAAQDPGQPYGSILPWPRSAANEAPVPADGQVESQPESGRAGRTLIRSTSAKVVLRNGELLAYLRADGSDIQIFLPEDEPDRTHAARDLATFLEARGQQQARSRRRGGTLIVSIDGANALDHPFAAELMRAGFTAGPAGLQIRRTLAPLQATDPEAADPAADEAEAETEADGYEAGA